MKEIKFVYCYKTVLKSLIKNIFMPRKILIYSLLLVFILFSKVSFAQNLSGGKSSSPKYDLTAKGNMYSGLTFSFSTKDTDKKQGLIVDVTDESHNRFKTSVDAGYFIKNNFALGALISYENDRSEQTETDSQNVQTAVKYAKSAYGVYGVMKNFIPLDEKRRFFLYNQILLGTSFKNSIEERTTDELLKRTYSKERSLELQINPGIMVNVVKGFSVEVGAQIAGFNATWSETQINDEITEKSHGTDSDFSINLLRLNIGFYYYFPLKKKQ